MRPNVVAVIDGMVGSCGKAKVIGEIATDKSVPLGLSITNCMPNAGHTFVDEKGRKTVFTNIPVSAVNKNAELFIGPGSAINMAKFKDELKRTKKYVGDRKIYVHEMVPLIEQRHIDYEKEHITSGSTFEGCAAVQMEKIARDPKLKFFKTFKNAVVCSNEEWLDRVYNHLEDPNKYVLLEGAQGVQLSLNHSGNYPHVTSRNVSVMQLLADSGISPRRLYESIMVIRPFPIRISDITRDNRIISSGDMGKGDPLTWSEVNIASMYGEYPCNGYLDLFEVQPYGIDVLRHYISYLPEKYLLQLFGINYRKKKLSELSIIEALELERLYFKTKGEDTYLSKILYLPATDSQSYPNEIVDQSEDTTISKGERKIADIDFEKLSLASQVNEVDAIYLNFFQHLDYDYYEYEAKGDIYLDKRLREHLRYIENVAGEKNPNKPKILALGTGARNGQRILRSDLLMRR